MPSRVLTFVTVGSLVASVTHASVTENIPPTEVRTLVEVRVLKALQSDVSALLVREKIGTDGIAAVREGRTTTQVPDPRLPARRFLIAGVSANYLLVAYEEADSGYPARAAAYRRDRAGWTQVGEWPLMRRPYSLNELVQLVNSPDREGSQKTMRILERVLKTM